MRVKLYFKKNLVDEDNTSIPFGNGIIGSLHLKCSRVATYTADGIDSPYMEITIEDPLVELEHWNEPLEVEKDDLES